MVTPPLGGYACAVFPNTSQNLKDPGALLNLFIKYLIY